MTLSQSEVETAPVPDGSRFAPRARSIAAAPYLGLTALVVVAFWPLLRGFPDTPWADGGDGSAFLWNFWRLPRAVLAGENPFTEQNLFFPVGAHTVWNTNTPLLSFLSWPIQQVVGLTGASVVVGLAAVLLSAFAAFALVRRVGCSRAVAFFAGAAFALLPWRTNRIITHLNLIHTELPVFALLAVLAFLDRPNRVRAIGLGAVGAAAVLVDFNTGVMAAMAVLIVLAVRWRETTDRAVVCRLALGAAVAVALCLPILVPLALDMRSGEASSPPGLGGAQAYSADVLSWVLPHPRHPLWGGPFEERYTSTTGHERFAYIGLVVAGLAVVGALARDRRRRIWLAVAGVFGVLSFGPALHVDGWTGSLFSYDGFRFSIPLPYLLLHQIPGFAAFRAPARFASVAGLALIVLAALGLQRLTERLASARAALAVALVATALVVVDYLPPTSYLILDPYVDPAYDEIAADPDPGAVLDIPLQFRTGVGAVGDGAGSDQSRFMFTATVHDRPMVGGSVSRLPAARFRALQAIGPYHDILRVQGAYGPSPEPPTFTGADLAGLGIRFVVVHHDSAEPRLVGHFAALGLEPFSSSPVVTVWKVPGPARR